LFSGLKRLLVAGCWLLVAGCWLLVTGYWLLVAGCWLLDAARSAADPGFRCPGGPVVGIACRNAT